MILAFNYIVLFYVQGQERAVSFIKNNLYKDLFFFYINDDSFALLFIFNRKRIDFDRYIGASFNDLLDKNLGFFYLYK